MEKSTRDWFHAHQCDDAMIERVTEMVFAHLSPRDLQELDTMPEEKRKDACRTIAHWLYDNRDK